MNFKQTWKRFWTLDRHHAEGFTLVELIVVIAILAILSAVAVPAYSGYIKKAHMSNDQTLIGEVSDALTLYYYSNPGAKAAYVVLTPTGARADVEYGVTNGVGAAAMEAVFGSNWAEMATLEYNEWTNNGLTNIDAGAIAGSTFTSIPTEELLSAVTGLTGVAGTIVGGYDGNVVDKLNQLGFTDAATKLNDSGLEAGTQEYTNAVSNLLVSELSSQMSGLSAEEAFEDEYAGTVLQYATLYAYCQSTGDTTTMDAVNEYLAGQTSMDSLKSDAFNRYLSSLSVSEGYNNYLASEAGAADANATMALMGVVNQISGGYTDGSDLGNSNLYGSASVAGQVNQYMNVVNASAVLGNLPTLNDGEILVVMVDGKVTTTAGTM